MLLTNLLVNEIENLHTKITPFLLDLVFDLLYQLVGLLIGTLRWSTSPFNHIDSFPGSWSLYMSTTLQSFVSVSCFTFLNITFCFLLECFLQILPGLQFVTGEEFALVYWSLEVALRVLGHWKVVNES